MATATLPPRVPAALKGGRVPRFDQGGQTTGGDRAKFIQMYAPIAQRWAAKTGIPASVFLGIAASESNFGNTPGYALFGLVGVNGTAGSQTLQTETGIQKFPAYKTPDDAFAAFVQTAQQPRYAQAWANRSDPAQFIAGLQQGGYSGSATANDRAWTNTILNGTLPAVQTAAKQQGINLDSAPAGGTAPPATQDPAKQSVYGTLFSAAAAEKGKRYAGPVIGEPDAARWGNPGWDCSSFVSYVYKQVGVNLTPYTDAAYGETQAVDTANARPGDIIFFRGSSPAQPNVKYQHMGIYLGNGQMIDAAYDGGVGVHQISSRAGLSQGYEIRRPEAMNKYTAPQAADVALATGQAVAQSNVNGGGTTPAAQQGYRANVDPALLEKYNTAVGQMTSGLARLSALQSKQANGALTNEEQFELMQLPGQITAAKAVVDVLQPMVKPGATESPLQQATMQAQINNSTATTLGSLQTAAANLVHTAFGDNLAAATYMQGIVKDAFDRAKDTYSLALQKGQLDLNGYAALVTATATAQTAEAAYALQALKNANYISDENWKRAQMLLPAGTHYQPGFAPNSPMNVALKGLGLGQMVMETTPLPADFNDPQKNLTAGSQASERMGYANPAQAFQPFISQLQGQVQRNAAAPGFTFAAPDGFAAQPVAAPSYADQTTAYQNIVKDFTNGAYVPQIAPAPSAGGGAPAAVAPSTSAAPTLGMGDLLALESTLATQPNTTTANSFMTIGPNGQIVGNTAPRASTPAQAISNAGTSIAQTVHSFLPSPTGVVGAVKPTPAGLGDDEWFDDPANGSVQFNRRGDRRVKPGT